MHEPSSDTVFRVPQGLAPAARVYIYLFLDDQRTSVGLFVGSNLRESVATITMILWRL